MIKSWNSWLSEFSVGERRYVDTSLEKYAQDMRTINTPTSRRPSYLKDKKFAASLFTAVSAKNAGEVRYLICIEREE